MINFESVWIEHGNRMLRQVQFSSFPVVLLMQLKIHVCS